MTPAQLLGISVLSCWADTRTPYGMRAMKKFPKHANKEVKKARKAERKARKINRGR